jgi:Putative Ig domain/Galactose oxidase, central domain
MNRARLVAILLLSGYLVNGCGGGSANIPIPLAITSQALPSGITHTIYAGSPSGFSLTASGGTAPYHWSWAATNGSSLPPGLNLSNASVSGTPTTTGSFTVIVTATDSASPATQQTANYTIQITAPASLSITSTSPPQGTVDAVYGGAGFTLSGSGGVTPYTWSWTAAKGSSLPPGLSLSNGSISGTPTLAGSYKVILTVTDSQLPAVQATSNLTLVIVNPPAPVISSSPAPPAGAVNVPYAGFTFKAAGSLPLTWSETGALPPGMVFSMDGALSGTPAAIGSFPITVAVQDALQQNAPPQDFTIEIDAKLPSFTATGSMQTARVSHTATLLGNGKVIVIGGQGDNGKTALASAELFDPSAGQFTLAGNLMTPRLFHTATLLQSGKVLVTGGRDVNGNAIAEAELFDPGTGSSTPTGAMNSVRTGHTATLLNDGRVLVAGGFDSSNASLSTAELFDPTTGEFTLANGPMAAGRADHTATLLSSGKVLVVGGSPNTALGEIFDPASNTFTSTTTKGTEVIFLTATLLVNGRVLVAGGLVNFVNINHCFSLYPPLSVASASIFDNGSASFLATGDMSSPRAEHTATVLGDGKVLVAGGEDFSARASACLPGQTLKALASAELYDPVHGAFALTSSMITARSRHTATLLANGDVVVIGGIDGAYFLASAELYH